MTKMDLPMANFVSSAPHGEKVIESFAKLKSYLAGGFKDFLFSPRNLGKTPSLTNTFQGGWFNHQLVIDLKPCFMTLSIQICQICPKISGICPKNPMTWDVMFRKRPWFPPKTSVLESWIRVKRFSAKKKTWKIPWLFKVQKGSTTFMVDEISSRIKLARISSPKKTLVN